MIVRDVGAQAPFREDKAGKSTLARGERLFVGLNAFEPGQGQAVHLHDDQDKAYHVVEGVGRIRVGGTWHDVRPGDVVFAGAGVDHGVDNPGPGRLVLLVAMAPPPGG